jgi:hypothetical protein
MLRELACEDPRLLIFLLLADRGILSKETVMKEGRLSNDQFKRTLNWLVSRGYVQRLFLYENGKRIAAYHLRATHSFLPVVELKRRYEQ